MKIWQLSLLDVALGAPVLEKCVPRVIRPKTATVSRDLLSTAEKTAKAEGLKDRD